MAPKPVDPTAWSEREEPIDLDASTNSPFARARHVAPTPKREPPDAEERAHLRAGFGALLREERLAAGYSQDELAKHTGLDDRTVQRFEAGEMRPTRPALMLLSLVINRPEVLTGRGGRPIRGLEADASDAFALVRQFEKTLGSSLAEGGERKSRISRARHLLRHGCTPEERSEQDRAAVNQRHDVLRRRLERMQAERALRSGNLRQVESALDALDDLPVDDWRDD